MPNLKSMFFSNLDFSILPFLEWFKKSFNKTTSKSKNFYSKKGFTLVEVLIAIGILAVLAAIIRSSYGGNIIRYKSSQIKIVAVELLQKKIIEIETLYKGRIENLPKEKQSGTFEEPEFKNYKWAWESQDLTLPDISALVSTEEEDSMVRTVLDNFRNYLNQSVKEVQVTVTYQIGKEKEYKFVVPFYMVNFENQLSLGITGEGGQSLESLQNQIPGGNPQPTGGGTPTGGGRL